MIYVTGGYEQRCQHIRGKWGYQNRTQGNYLHFVSLILPAINDTSEKRKCPKSSFIYDRIIQTQALNADKVLIKSIIVKLRLEDKIVTPFSPQDKDSFYNSAKVTDNTRYDPSQNQIHCINSSDISSSIYSETALSVENNLPTLIREGSMANSGRQVLLWQIKITNLEQKTSWNTFLALFYCRYLLPWRHLLLSFIL